MIGIELARAGPGYVRRFEFENLNDAAVAAPSPDDDAVARTNSPVRLAVVAVDLNPPAPARGLRLRASLEKTRRVKPDIEANGVVSHTGKFRGCRPIGQAGRNKSSVISNQ